VKYFGRTEYIVNEQQTRVLVWVVFRAGKLGDFANGERVAYFARGDDAAAFIKSKETP
jgi:hypothetical protein